MVGDHNTKFNTMSEDTKQQINTNVWQLVYVRGGGGSDSTKCLQLSKVSVVIVTVQEGHYHIKYEVVLFLKRLQT